ncbi:BTAD domain-containing putative transcriptional regulator [Brevibacillus choshinensis]|uniref:BTAD domain-containing putative transcriptional regulator n=1 Tax=Brevibacillus choshinensis TaxID=54911 RepID=UPI002E1A5086|nr:BTAD domain-containing putative transcriptional regulator [Brevibacillus choshinensis]
MKIFESKLSPPELTKCFPRERLFLFLDQHLHKTLLSITCEGGYGKTTLISSYLKARSISAVWYRLETSDRNPHTFLAYLTAGLGKHVGREKMPDANENRTAAQAIDQLVAMMAACEERILIVLDDYHLLKDQEEIKQIMVQLFHSSPPLITFIVTGRMKPDLPLVQMKLRQQLAELSTQDMAFNLEETESLFRELFHLDISLEEMQLILRKTEGWAASLVLLWDVLKNLNDTQRKHFITHMGITEDIYSYLVTEVLGQQNEELQDFLLHTSLLEELEPAIINRWLDISHAQKMVDHLHTHHLFIYRDHRRAYRYHQLFKVFLYQRLKSEVSQAEINQKHVQLGGIYEQNQQLLRAFVHYTWGNEYLEAARLMRIMVNRYRPEWFLHVVDGALEALSPDHSLATTSLFLFRCVPLAIMEELIPVLEESIKRKQEKNGLAAELQHRLANIYFYRGDIKRSQALFLASAEGAEQAQDFALVALNLSMLSQNCRLQDKPADAIRYARQSLSYSEHHGIPPHVLMHGLWNLAEVLLMQKELDSAETFIQETIAVSDLCDEASKAFPYSSMNKLYRLRREYEKAIEWGRKAVSHASRFRIDTDIGWANMELGITYIHAQEPELAEECLCEAQRYFQKYTHFYRLSERVLAELKASQTYTGSSVKSRPLALEAKHLCINILGQFIIQCGQENINITRKTSLYLFLLLLTNRGRRLTKDYIMEELFPDDGMETALNKFYVSLSILRKNLEPELDNGRNSAYVKQDGDNYFLSMENIRVDADDFLQWTSGKEWRVTPLTIDQFLKAESCYRGDFARDFPYQSFLVAEREMLRSCYMRVLEGVARYYWDQKHIERSIHYYDKILEEDPYSEHIYQEYVARLLEAKLVVKARRVYARGKRYLEEELGIPLQLDLILDEKENIVRKK